MPYVEYEPTAEEIRTTCADIQRGWNTMTECHRRVESTSDQQWQPPRVRTARGTGIATVEVRITEYD